MKRIVTLVASVLAAVGLIYIAWDRNGFFDSTVYYGAVKYWFRDGGMVYDWLKPETPYGFTYPPFAGLVMSPMSVLPFPVVVLLASIGTVLTVGLLVRWLAGPMLRGLGKPLWFTFGVAFALALAFEPVRETFSFGQVNTLLLTLVTADLLFGVARGRWWGGVGIGLATAIKLTPGVFILYLLVTRRWREAGTAIAAASAATVLAGALFPDQSREFWTSALWDTNRVGSLWFLSNQSERGMIARLPFDEAESKIWLVCVLATLAWWALRVARAPEDVVGGLALTGVLGCLISPVTWIHHCVWLIPALIRCVEANRRGPAALAAGAYAFMTSHLTWLWENRPYPPVSMLGSNIYVLFSLALLIWTPVGVRSSAPAREPDKVLA
ncbi:glycosyltransferase 87 family protein [Actinoplanes siamensis]|uniref:Polyprenol-phosphate-mannose-dependent alpha-(1-2)-phosphatidylinositol pentamannoside mannosyltransferase n=1 Tax=Actinoplanes siamensis TaxID=1223317 RepID=A0A919TIG0_9ACTN|nr:glycosyltransferase 87 family protein [Actinoplanes siamensis]GIF04461.1 polyprenol-phosphate-mannose-dependent alpha-(1-2)-phosphatidylinositol pentamannoside mannosyltransferase [Actinoplanes siamensis]